MTHLFRGAASWVAAVLLGIVLAPALAEIVARLGGVRIGIDPDAYLAVSAPGVQYTLRPGWRGLSFDAPVAVNHLGFRAPEPRPGATIRILFIGDSFTFGFGVREEETYPRRFERARRAAGQDVDVVNLAVAGYDSVQAVAALAANIDALRPRCVIYGAVPNDEAPPQFMNRDGMLVPTQSLAPWIPLELRRILARSRAVQFVMRRINVLQAKRALTNAVGIPAFTGDFPSTRAAMRRLRELADAQGARAYVLILPFVDGLPDRYPFAPAHASLARAARDAGIPHADALPAVREAVRRGTPFESLWVDPFDHHPNAKAQAIFARVLEGTGWCR